jgi:hypothetical protein
MSNMNDDLRQRLEATLRAPKPSALEVARTYLAHHLHDADRETLELDVRGMLKINPGSVIDAVESIEELLAAPQDPGTLHELVLYDGNRMLSDDTDATAAAWLRQLADQLRVWLGENAPPPKGG